MINHVRTNEATFELVLVRNASFFLFKQKDICDYR
jgi:hypothetical protein